jgi:hypothetical protein
MYFVEVKKIVKFSLRAIAESIARSIFWSSPSPEV